MIQSFDWIKNAIDSSTNEFHLEGCQVLIELFKSMYGAAGEEMAGELLGLLIQKKIQISVHL